VAKKIWKYVFPPVNIKYSVFSVLLGAATAWIYGYAGEGIPEWGQWLSPLAAVALVAFADFLGEGAWQHGFDILNDTAGGLSGFREDPSNPLVRKLAKLLIYSSLGIMLTIGFVLLFAGRLWIPTIGLSALALAWLYSHRRNECIPAVAVALAAAAGWFSVTNVVGPELLPTVLIAAMTAKLSLAFYRYDDYKGLNTVADFMDDMEVLIYYRNLFWIIFWYPWLAMCLVLYNVMQWYVPTLLSILPLVEIVYRRRWFCHVSNH